MVGACQQNSRIFLVRSGGPDGRSAVSGGGAGDQITWAGSGLGAARDRTGCRRGPRLGPGRDTGGGRGRDWERDAVGGRGLGRDKMPVTKSHGQVADSERPGTGRDAGGDRGLGRDKMPAGAEA